MKQVTTFEFNSERIEQQFLSDYQELLAHYSSQAVVEGMASFLSMNYTTAELQTAPVTPGAYRKMLALALMTLLNRNALEPLTADLNELAEKDLAELRKETGIDVELIPAPEPPAPTAEELLSAEVRSDWKQLSSDQLRKKKANSRAYSNMLEKLANDGTLESSVTSLRIAGS